MSINECFVYFPVLVSKRWKILIYFIISDLSCSIYFGIFAINMKRIVIVFSLLLSCAVCVAQVKIKDAKALPLKAELVADFADWTPDSVKIKGSTQGFAIHGNDCVVIRDKGECDIFDMEKKEMIGHFKQPGDTSHNNNANFGTERYSDTSRYPLFYTSECRGLKRCFVKDLSLDDAPIVQMFDYYEDVYNGPMDWDLDRDNGFIYTYGGERFGRRWVRKFRLPKFSDSDSEGYVHLTKAHPELPRENAISW